MWNCFELEAKHAEASKRNGVVGNSGTTIPITPVPVLNTPTANSRPLRIFLPFESNPESTYKIKVLQ